MPTTAVLPVKPTPGWVPHVRAARQYAAHRPGSVAFSLRIGNRVYGRRSYISVPAMSLMKPILLAAYLRRPRNIYATARCEPTSARSWRR